MKETVRMASVFLLLAGSLRAGEPAALIVEPPALRLGAGERAAFIVSATTADGFHEDVSASVSSSTADSDLIQLDASGTLRALRPGQAIVSLTLGDRQAELPVEITPPAPGPVSFIRDVLPVLGRAGCSAAACHARADGQNGFKLSVFSFDPRSDYRQIVYGARSRRVFPSEPGESLLLLKATGEVPHEGGERFARDSDAWRTLASWIGSGMSFENPGEAILRRVEVFPKERRYRKGAAQRLILRAHYSDGSVRDVTSLSAFQSNDKQIVTVDENGRMQVDQVSGQAVVVARYMGMVDDSRVVVPEDRVLQDDAYQNLPVRNFIDEKAWARHRQLGLLPSAPCSDAEFIRRASLDVTGMLPGAEEARQFLADADPDKRWKLVDRLLESPAYADHWAAKFADLFRPNPDRVGVKVWSSSTSGCAKPSAPTSHGISS